jgi:Domain of unknown function (DUF4259)
MGAWSHESFGNDDACDWGSELEGTTDLEFIEATLDGLLAKGSDYLEASDASQAIAAAETVARLQGNFAIRDAYSQGVDEWVEQVRLVPPVMLRQKAHRALDRILEEPSELLELWQEGDGEAAWVNAVRDLKARIRV